MSRRRIGTALGVVGIAAVLVVVGVAVLRGFTADPTVTTESMTFEPQARQLTVDVGSGDLTVGRADGDHVEVTRTVRTRGSGDPQYSETSTAGGVVLSADCSGGFFGGCSVVYDVRVPDGFALDLRTGSGRVEAADVDVGSATLRASSGDLHVAGLRGPVDLETSSGEISGERLDARTVRASTSSGDVTLDFATAPSTLDVDVSSGEVGIALPADAAYRVQVDTGSGEQTVTVPVDDAAISTVTVETGSGDVAVHPR
jgi:hypothetical protein